MSGTCIRTALAVKLASEDSCPRRGAWSASADVEGCVGVAAGLGVNTRYQGDLRRLRSMLDATVHLAGVFTVEARSPNGYWCRGHQPKIDWTPVAGLEVGVVGRRRGPQRCVGRASAGTPTL